MATGRVYGGDDAEVVYSGFGLREYVYVTLYAAYAEKVLTLKEAAGAPAVYYQCERVGALLYERVEIVFGRSLGVFVITDLFAVDIYVHARFGTAYVQEYVAVELGVRYFEVVAVDPYGHSLGKHRRFGVYGAELVRMVGVERCAEALYLPVSRHLYRVPFLCVGYGEF